MDNNMIWQLLGKSGKTKFLNMAVNQTCNELNLLGYVPNTKVRSGQVKFLNTAVNIVMNLILWL